MTLPLTFTVERTPEQIVGGVFSISLPSNKAQYFNDATVVFYGGWGDGYIDNSATLSMLGQQSTSPQTTTYGVQVEDGTDYEVFMAVLLPTGTAAPTTFTLDAMPIDNAIALIATAPSPLSFTEDYEVGKGLARSIMEGMDAGTYDPKAPLDPDWLKAELGRHGFDTSRLKPHHTRYLSQMLTHDEGPLTKLQAEYARCQRAGTSILASEKAGCYACQVGYAVGLVAIFVALLVIAALIVGLIVIAPASAVPIGTAVIISIPLIAGSAAWVGAGVAAAIVAAGTVAGAAAVAIGIPRMLCEAQGTCSPAIGSWSREQGVGENLDANTGPSMTAMGDTLYLVYGSSDNQVKLVTWQGDDWTSPATLDGITSHQTPAIAYFEATGEFFLFTVDSSGNVQARTSPDASAWSAPVDTHLSTQTGVSVVSDLLNGLQIWGNGTNSTYAKLTGAVYQDRGTGYQWATGLNPGSLVSSYPVGVSTAYAGDPSNPSSRQLFAFVDSGTVEVSMGSGTSMRPGGQTFSSIDAGVAACAYDEYGFIAYVDDDTMQKVRVIYSYPTSNDAGDQGQGWSGSINVGGTSDSTPALCEFIEMERLICAWKEKGSGGIYFSAFTLQDEESDDPLNSPEYEPADIGA